MQKIIFGSPGTGKSYKIQNEILPNSLKIKDTENCVKTVFHPEYTYGDFMGKLLPLTIDKKVEYNFYEGHFLTALAKAYKNILDNENKYEKAKNVALVIDELNRGNSAAIFGTIFQLLDRETNGWSSYEISISEMEFKKLLELVGFKFTKESFTYKGKKHFIQELNSFLGKLKISNKDRKIKLPPNLHILATMNTSDSSIYYMDSAFKRRWDWEFLNPDSEKAKAKNKKLQTKNKKEDWVEFIDKLNKFIKSKSEAIRKIEDKQIGYWFIKEEIITTEHIKNKLMFFIWDSVFGYNKQPLAELLNVENKKNELVTFGDFTEKVDIFIKKIIDFK